MGWASIFHWPFHELQQWQDFPSVLVFESDLFFFLPVSMSVKLWVLLSLVIKGLLGIIFAFIISVIFLTMLVFIWFNSLMIIITTLTPNVNQLVIFSFQVVNFKIKDLILLSSNIQCKCDIRHNLLFQRIACNTNFHKL